MLLGIDVGGTHTDAALVDDGRLAASVKVPTDHRNLLHSIRTALTLVLEGRDPGRVRRLNLSTTLSTNAIVEGRTEDVGVIVSAGPGIDPENVRTGRHYYVVAGSIDHRGRVVQDLDPVEVDRAAQSCRAHGVRVYAVVTKFSTRNPDQERALIRALGPVDFVTPGHKLSGVLNFPRRVATAYFNAALWRIYNDFAWAVEESAEEFGLAADLRVLKADGGTMPLGVSKDLPVESILSGPAASVMGILALCSPKEDALILDVGGTTTDIALLADGEPVIEPGGMTVGSYPTLVRALRVRSIGLGGDSALGRVAGRVIVGPERKGPPLCVRNQYPQPERSVPALTDALNVLGLAKYGDVDESTRGIETLAGKWSMTAQDLAAQALAAGLDRLKATADEMVKEINEKPVYTLRELLQGKKIVPQKVYVMGGPAAVLAPRIEAVLGLPVVVPEHWAMANAIGAALTRTTLDLELFADTGQGRALIPSLGEVRSVNREYSLDQARTDTLDRLTRRLEEIGAADAGEIEVVEAEAFNMIEGHQFAGRNIRVRCQARPGVVQSLSGPAAGTVSTE